MKALKGLLIYIGIVLGIILGIGLILLCIMYFFPNVRIFGLGVVHYNKQAGADTVVLSEYSEYSDIELNVNSKKINISIEPAEVDKIEYEMKLRIFGISTEIVEYQLVKNVEVKDNKLNIFLNVSEPNGWISTSNSELIVKVPYTEEYNIITNTKLGNIELGSSDNVLDINNLSITTSSGSLILDNLGNGKDGEKLLNLNTLNLTTGNGNFDFSTIRDIKVAHKVKLTANGGKFKFNNLDGSVEISGDEVTLNARNIVAGSDGFKVIARSGYFKIGEKLSSPIGAENTFVTDNATIEINEIDGKTGIDTVYGSIAINILNDDAEIRNTNGQGVSIKSKACGNLMIFTGNSNIFVNEYYKSGTFESTRGDINVTSKANYNKEYKTVIKNVDGKVTVKNKINHLVVNTTGMSTVNVTFDEIKANFENANDIFQHQVVVGENVLSCTVYIPTAPVVPFRFRATGSISGEIAGLSVGDLYDVEESEQEQYYPGQDSMSESMNNAHFLFSGKIVLKGWTPNLNSN